jgi:chromosome segregation protein
MHLAQIKIAGFKSFADLTAVAIKGKITAVAGPNGCGKSNIVDAIRWVIGESSAKQLRGELMCDVIFNGTDTRKRAGKAWVALHFDNQSGRAGGQYTAFAEIVIRREITRDGQSTYRINDLVVRRRDVLDIFLGTGLGPRSYSIIEQGMISALIESKPEACRTYLEEAAGISKYKERRRDTAARIVRTEENIARVDDILSELTQQLRRLKRQASAAARYQAYETQEARLSCDILALKWAAYLTQASDRKEALGVLLTSYEGALREQTKIDSAVEALRLAQIAERDACAEAQAVVHRTATEIADIENKITAHQNQLTHWQAEETRAKAGIVRLTEVLDQYASQRDQIESEKKALPPLAEQQRRYEDAQATFQAAESAQQTAQQALETIETQRQVASRESDRLATEHRYATDRVAQIEAREEKRQLAIDSLGVVDTSADQEALTAQQEAAASALEAASSQVQHLREEITALRAQCPQLRQQLQEQQSAWQREQGRLAALSALQSEALAQPGVITDEDSPLAQAQPLARCLAVEPGWEWALEVVLGPYFKARCVSNLQACWETLHTSEQDLTVIDHQSGTAVPVASAFPLPTLLEQVRSNYDLSPWLASVHVASSPAEALQYRDQLSPAMSIITPDGFWLGRHWATKCHQHEGNAAILNRENMLIALTSTVASWAADVETTTSALSAVEGQLAERESEKGVAESAYAACQQTVNALSLEQQALAAQGRQRVAQYDALCAEQTAEGEEKESLGIHVQDLAFKEAEQAAALQGYAVALAKAQTQRAQTTAAYTEAQQAYYEVKSLLDAEKIQRDAYEQQLRLLAEHARRHAHEITQCQDQLAQLADQLSQTGDPGLQEQLQEKLLGHQQAESVLANKKQKLADHDNALLALSGKRQTITNQVRDKNEAVQRVRLELEGISARQQTIEEQTVEQSMTLKELTEREPTHTDILICENEIAALKDKMNRLGPINLAAISEHESLSARCDYLTEQKSDLTDALNTLSSAIAAIDQETQRCFKATFETVNSHFKALFPIVFGGGQASLSLTEGNYLSAGVVISAQPPGKQNSRIHLLSGGEKALTAIALVFALFTLNPAPFCVLDEVDAPLDDANVLRFCQLVKSMSDSTQFIMISHNKVTIEMADYLMGVTMQEPGVSRLVSVDVQEAVALTEE